MTKPSVTVIVDPAQSVDVHVVQAARPAHPIVIPPGRPPEIWRPVFPSHPIIIPPPFVPPDLPPPIDQGPVVDFVRDFGAPTDGSTSAAAALDAWLAFGAANPGASLVMPPHKYNFPTGFAPLWGVQNGKIVGNGAEAYVKDCNPFIGTANMFPMSYATCGLIETVGNGARDVVLRHSDDVAKFIVGHPVCVTGLELQGGIDCGYPPNFYWCEYRTIEAINGDVITFDRPLDFHYKHTWPHVRPIGSGAFDGGPAALYALNPLWNTRQTIIGLTINANWDTYFGGAREVVFDGVTWADTGPAASICDRLIFRNCNTGKLNEVDKTARYVEYDNCEAEWLFIQSTSIQHLVIKNSRIGGITGSAKVTEIHDSEIRDNMQAGGIYGGARKLILRNSTIPHGSTPYAFMDLPKYRYADGQFRIGFTDVAANNAFQACNPGCRYVMGFYYGAAAYWPDNGEPNFEFTVTDLYLDGEDLVIATDATAATLPPLTYWGNQPNAIFRLPFTEVEQVNSGPVDFTPLMRQPQL